MILMSLLYVYGIIASLSGNEGSNLKFYLILISGLGFGILAWASFIKNRPQERFPVGTIKHAGAG